MLLSGYNFTTGWDNVSKTPIATNLSVKGGKKFQIGEEGNLNIFGTLLFLMDLNLRKELIEEA